MKAKSRRDTFGVDLSNLGESGISVGRSSRYLWLHLEGSRAQRICWGWQARDYSKLCDLIFVKRCARLNPELRVDVWELKYPLDIWPIRLNRSKGQIWVWHSEKYSLEIQIYECVIGVQIFKAMRHDEITELWAPAALQYYRDTFNLLPPFQPMYSPKTPRKISLIHVSRVNDCDVS